MNRRFLVLAVVNVTLLALTYVVGFLAGPVPETPRLSARTAHFLLGLTSTMFTLLVHSIVYTYFIGTGKWVKEVVRVYGMPDWPVVQAKKNKRRAFPFAFWSCMAVGVAAWMGAGTDALGWPSWWHLVVASLAIGFNLGAYLVEYAAIEAQARLILDVKERADAMRLAASASPSPSPSTAS